MTQETAEEPKESGEIKTSLLISVLAYDDLLTPFSRIFQLAPGEKITIRRGESAAIAPPRREGDSFIVNDRWLSGKHMAMEITPTGAARISDQNSKNGTFVNCARVQEAELADGDLIEVGHSLFIYRAVPERYLRGLDEHGVLFGSVQTYCAEVASLVRRIEIFAPSADPILIVGETGSGKEVVAEAIHRASKREGLFLPVDCAALDAASFDTHLLEEAAGGTLFLDHAGNLDERLQARLLRVLESREPDVRWVASTDRELDGERSNFRRDLFHRLSHEFVRIPPLRKRREDLGAFFSSFLKQAGYSKVSINPAAARELCLHAFPGNIRQLRAVLSSAARLAGDGPIELAHWAERSAVQVQEPAPRAVAPPLPAKTTPLLKREDDYWALSHEGRMVRLVDSVGLHYLAHLLENPGREFHVLDLTAIIRGAEPGSHAGGDAGAMLDATAKEEYRRRIESLRSELEEAREWGDLGRAEKAESELERITEELARGVGLGGRDRKAASNVERARVNITQQIKRAMKKIEEHAPELARALTLSVKTGTYCSYQPPP